MGVRFRYEGTNWEGRRWVVSDAVRALGSEVEALDPFRRSVDGTVASKGHDANNPGSDHRPHPYNASPGIVRAIDIGVSREQGDLWTERLRRLRDSRLRYLIFNRRIFASYSRPHRPAWEWGPRNMAHLRYVAAAYAEQLTLRDNRKALALMKTPS